MMRVTRMRSSCVGAVRGSSPAGRDLSMRRARPPARVRGRPAVPSAPVGAGAVGPAGVEDLERVAVEAAQPRAGAGGERGGSAGGGSHGVSRWIGCGDVVVAAGSDAPLGRLPNGDAHLNGR